MELLVISSKRPSQKNEDGARANERGGEREREGDRGREGGSARCRGSVPFLWLS